MAQVFEIMDKRYLKAIVSLLAVFAVGFGIILIGNIITIGERIGDMTHVFFEYAFYVLLVVLAIVFILVPTFRILRMPSLPEMDVDECEPLRKTKKLAKRLADTSDDPEFKDRIAAAANDAVALRDTVKKELDKRFGEARKEILKAAAYSFASTSVSQNNAIDTISVLMINCKLVYKVIQSTGFRPNMSQLVRVYVSVMSGAFLAHITQSGVERGMTTVVNSFVKGLKNIPFGDVIMGSAIDGTINALMTLRVGNLALSYLKKGAKGHLSDAELKAANISAIKSLPGVVGAKFKAIGEFATKFVASQE